MISMSRREALKIIYRAIVAAGAAQFISYKELLAAEIREEKKANLVWLHGTSCSGCSCSFLNVEGVSVLDIVTKFTNMIYHPDISLATGSQVIEILEKVSTSNLPFVLVLEGGIPVKMPHACLMGDQPFTYWIDKLVPKASACVAAGTCATQGGITRMAGMENVGSMTLSEYLKHKKIQKPVINLPNCPLKPDHLVYSLLHYLKTGAPPPLDREGRPMKYFKETVHDKCIYYADFQERRFATKAGALGCLLKLGCQGPVTYNDCMVNGHNGGVNICIRAAHPCIGCANETFPRQIMFHSYNDKRAAKKNFKT